jgi:FKBP-type peptidyl-prolyl cis-trans isomerase
MEERPRKFYGVTIFVVLKVNPDTLEGMNLRSIVPVVVLIGAALFLVFRSDDDKKEAPNSEKSKSGQAIQGKSSGSAGNEDGNRRVVSKRVSKDQPKVVMTESGLEYEVLTEGEGAHPGPTSRVKVHYTGTLADGTVFDSSRDRGQPAVFGLNQVIKGWTEGLQLMKPGAVYRFVIPPDLAYGESGAGKSIPGGSTLTFEVELISIEKP